MYRFADPHNNQAAISPQRAATWLPVDQYTGGAEHAVMHLLYARFFNKAARDMGILPTSEPFTRLFNQGVITKDGHKMSKSRGNVVAPDDWVAKLGADTVRLYLMFLGPWDQGGDWDDSGIQGHARWLNRVWALALNPVDRAPNDTSASAIRRLTHQMIKKVTGDIAAFRFNTMLAAMMEFTNALARQRDAGPVDGDAWDEAIRSLVLCLAPSAPHITEEIWERIGRPYSVHTQPWPTWDPQLVQQQHVTIVVQVNGKVRGQIDLDPGRSESDATTAAQGLARVQTHLAGKTVRKVIYVPDKLINFVVG
jgi:leucyl-tRNA synthetase